MKKLLSLLFVLSLIIGVTLALGITSSAEEEAFFPEINEITETPLNIEAYGITYDSIVSRYPDKLNVTHRDGKLYVEDFGMPNLCFDDYHASKIYNFELIDGQWVADYTESDYSSTGRFEIRDGDWTLSYYNEEFNYLSYDKSDSDTGFELYVSINGLYISYDLVIKGVDCYVNNFYSTTNDLEKNEVYLNEKFLYVTYEADGTLSSISAYQSNWYYLNEGDVWSENYSGSSVCEAPAGFEEYTYEGVLDMLPCVIDCGNHSYTEFSCTQDEYCINCYKLERKAPGHIFSESNCITPKICYNCGETQDDPTGHSWIYDGKMMSCAICDAVDALPTIPTPENVTYVSKNLSAHGIYHSEIWDVFVKSLDTTYENGVLSIKNCGFESLRFYSLYDDRHYDPTLVDNFWQIEMSEDVYNYQLYVYVTYDGWEGLFSDFETLEYIYYSDYYPSYWSAHVYKDAFILSLEMNIGERNIAVENRYNKDGDLTLSISYSYIDGNSIYVEYNSDRSLSLISLIYNGSWHYYCDEYGWSESPVFRTSCAEPDGFYGYTEATFTAFLPCLIECEGEHSYTTLTCTQDKYCTVCYTIEQTAPGHSFADADCTNSKTCTVCDETEGDALGHSFNNATCLLPMTCTVCGETEGDPLGHSWTDATCEAPKTCALCGETDGNALGHSWVDASCYQPLYCDVCGMSEGDPLEHYWRYSETERLCLNCSTVEEFLPLPTFDYPDRVANNLSDYGIDFSDLLSNFELDIISYYEDGIIYVKDEGFDTVSVYAFNSFNSYPLTLTDGIWHMEMDEDTLNAGMLIETTRDGWEISYRGNHLDIATFSDDEYLYYKFSVYDDMLIIEFDLNFNDILYRICGYYYSNGTLEKLKVTGYEIATSAFVYYNADRTPIYAGLMPEYNWYYYTEELGWLTSIAYETPAEAPAGFENYTIETFTALLPCFLECEGEHSYTTLTCTQDKYCTVCYKFVEKTAGHDWLAGNCFTPKTCLICGEIEGDANSHYWLYSGDTRSCMVCDATSPRVFFPQLVAPNVSLSNLSGYGIMRESTWDLFVKILTFDYSEGFYSVKDEGFSAIYIISPYTGNREDFTLIDNIWYFEMSEELYNADFYVQVEVDGWTGFYYYGYLQLMRYGNISTVGWEYALYESNAIISYVDTTFDEYMCAYLMYDESGDLINYATISMYNGYEIQVCYNPDRSFYMLVTFTNNNIYLYNENYGWSTGSSFNNTCDAPEHFEHFTNEYIVTNYPCFISCNNHTYSELTCTQHSRCTVCYEIDTLASGHTLADAICIAPKTCTVCGETEGDALGHIMDDATCFDPKTCSVCGETEGDALGHSFGDAACLEVRICTVCGETEGEALGHSWVDATTSAPKTCSVCGETEGEPLVDTPADSSENSNTEDNSSEVPGTEDDGLSGGAIAGITIASTATAGVGTFSLIWFVIKKKSLSDLLAWFTK